MHPRMHPFRPDLLLCSEHTCVPLLDFVLLATFAKGHAAAGCTPTSVAVLISCRDAPWSPVSPPRVQIVKQINQLQREVASGAHLNAALVEAVQRLTQR